MKLNTSKSANPPAGGEALAAADTAAMLAAREAKSGAWLAELEGGSLLPRIAAPGLPRGVFGAWAEPELPVGASGELRWSWVLSMI